MPRKTNAVTPVVAPEMNHEVIAADLKAADETNANAAAMAEQFGYEGRLTVGSLEDEIRFYQRRSVEAVMELGKRLLILKELTPHGEFTQRIELLGVNGRMAQRFMSATLKFSKSDTKSVLLAAGSQTKLLELAMLDDEEIAALSKGGSARGITIDEIDCMSTTELRAALREANDDIAAKEQLITDKNAKIDKLSVKGRKRADPWPEEVAGLKDDVHGLALIMDEALGKTLTMIDATEVAIDQVEPGSDPHNGYKTVVHHIGETVERLVTLVAGLRDQYDTRLAGYIDLDKTHTLED